MIGGLINWVVPPFRRKTSIDNLLNNYNGIHTNIPRRVLIRGISPVILDVHEESGRLYRRILGQFLVKHDEHRVLDSRI